MARVERRLELWADSFKEGEWFVESLLAGYTPRKNYRHNFQPVYQLTHPHVREPISVEVYGDYRGWTGVPTIVTNLLEIGKPDAVLLDPEADKIILAVEETAAVPTGNQALQRLERVWGAAESRIPFAYLIPEYGLHADGGLRRASIWPSYMALKLSMQYRTPSITLMYGDQNQPTAYNVGPGLALLAGYVSLLVRLHLTGEPDHEEHGLLKKAYQEMTRFISDHAEDITPHLPGRQRLVEERIIDLIVQRVKGVD